MSEYSKSQPDRQAPGGDSNPTHSNMIKEAKVFKAVEGVGFFSGENATSHSRGKGQNTPKGNK
jgi:hypothetical protein